jgi:hypothetical protein
LPPRLIRVLCEHSRVKLRSGSGYFATSGERVRSISSISVRRAPQLSGSRGSSMPSPVVGLSYYERSTESSGIAG